MTRRERLVELLRRFPETLPAFGSAGFGGDDGGPGMPAVYRSYPIQELVRCLGVLEREDPLARRHVVGRFCGETTVLDVRRRGGVLVGLPLWSEAVGVPVSSGVRRHGFELVRVRVHVYARWVEPRLVERGLDVLEAEFRGEPTLPKAFVAS